MALRIDFSSPTHQFSPDSPTTERATSDFSKALSDVKTQQHRQLKDFLTRLDSLSNKLVQSLSIKDLEEFRGTVKSFLRSTFGQSGRMQEETFWDMHGRHKVLTRLTKINSSLDELGKEFLDSNPNPLDVLSKIDQIRGLILDLFA